MSHGLLNALGGAPYPIPLDQELDLVQTESQGSDFSDEVIKGHAPSLCSLGVSLPEFHCPGNTPPCEEAQSHPHTETARKAPRAA